MKYYVYITTNLINGKQYVGDHSTNDLNDRYIGSGRPAFNNAKKKYGKENFELKILEFFPTKQEAFDAQEKYIKEYNTLTPNGYNISPKGGLNVIGCFSKETKEKIKKSLLGRHLSEETKQKISKSKKGKINSNEHNKKISIALYKRVRKEETNRKISEANKGKKISEEHKKKISLASSNRIWSDESRQKLRNSKKGLIKTEKHRKNLSISLKGRKLSKKHKQNISIGSKNKSNTTLQKMSIAKKGKTWEEIYGIEGAKQRRRKLL